MTNYVKYKPGPAVEAEYGNFNDAFGAVMGDLELPWLPAWAWGFSGPPTGLDWGLTAVTYVANSGQPYISYRFDSYPALHTVEVRFRLSAALWGMLDPSVLFYASHLMPTGYIGRCPYATYQAWRTAVGNVLPIWGSFALRWFSFAAGGEAAATATATAMAYTDGARAGQHFGVSLLLTYNPNATELAAGILQLLAIRAGVVSDAADGTVNAVTGTLIAGESAQNNVPFIQVQPGDAATAWNDFQLSVADIEVAVSSVVTEISNSSVLNINNVSNSADLGQPGHPCNEPAAPQVQVEVFGSPGMVPALYNTPSKWELVTTLPGAVLGLMTTLGQAVANFVAGGGLAKAIDWLTAGTQAAQNWKATADGANDVKRVAVALEKIGDVLAGVPADPETYPGIRVLMREVRDSLTAVADTRNLLHVKVRGIEVQAESGAIIE